MLCPSFTFLPSWRTVLLRTSHFRPSLVAAVGLYALGAETADSQSGVAAAAAARRLSAFDTLGTDAGRYTLVSLLTGGQQGYFSSTAHGVSAFPNVPVP